MIQKCDIHDIRTLVKPESVDLIILDPPYGVGNKSLSHKEKRWHKSDQDWDTFKSVDEQYEFYVSVLEALFPLLKKTGSMFVFGSFHSIFLTGEILQRRIKSKIINSIVWHKLNAMFNISRRALVESSEYIIWTAPSQNTHYFDYEYSRSVNHDKCQLRNVWESGKTPVPELCGHPHQKPFWLIRRLIKLACPKGGFVLDPMCGSGTTEIVCYSERIESLCTDINDNYLKIAEDRYKQISSYDMFGRE